MRRMENINILPMACVGLILVLVMMVIAPLVMTHTQTPVEVPRAHTAETKTEENLTVTYTVEGQLFRFSFPTEEVTVESTVWLD